MQTKRLLNGMIIPSIGFGTFGMGGDHQPDYTHDTQNIQAIKNAIKLGYTHIDTAQKYGEGHTEELVGKAIKFFERSSLFITTKLWMDNLAYENVISSINESLNRLGTKYVDLLLIHSPSKIFPIKDTMAAMNEQVDKNLVKAIGVSNFNKAQFQEAQKFSKHKLVANELKYNLWAKKIDIDSIRFCQDNSIMVIAHKPFGRGKIYTDNIQLLESLEKKYSCPRTQIVLAWLIQKKNMVTIFQSADPLHMKENLGALDIKISQEDCARIDELVKTSLND